MDAFVSNRKSQNMFVVKLRRRLAKQRSVDPAVTAFLDDELERAIARAADALKASPRSGLRKWLSALTAEKDRRAMRRQQR
jgi:hypothetical protein